MKICSLSQKKYCVFAILIAVVIIIVIEYLDVGAIAYPIVTFSMLISYVIFYLKKRKQTKESHT